ncbi:MAG: Rad52/Rad22 family DNA repair protein [Bacilli bacterium]|jgi:hypothetical protein
MNRQILEQPFPQNLIKSRKGFAGKQLAYVEGSNYIERLNQAFEGEWSFEILQHEVQASEVIVLGKLTAGGIVKAAFGGSAITIARDTGETVSLADDLKSAATDSLKKACSLLGIGLHLYSSETVVPQNEQPKVKTANGDRLTQKQLAAIWSIARNLGMGSDEARRRCVKAFNCVPEQLSKSDASYFIQELAEEQRGAA